MRVEFRNPDPEDETIVATASWDGAVAVSCEDPALRERLERAFRSTPVVVSDDSSYRRQGTSGAVVIQPGSLEWFRAAAQVRAPTEAGVRSRLIPGVTSGGFDPAANYRRFDEQLERLDARARGNLRSAP